MHHGKWLIGYGVVLALCGIAGYLSNPAAAKTALISGSVFGGLSALLGLAALRGIRAARPVAMAVTVFLSAVFLWRSVVSWQAAAAGEPKVFAASLISLMLVATVVTLGFLISCKPAGRE